MKLKRTDNPTTESSSVGAFNRGDRGYVITGAGNVVVNVGRLLRAPRAKQLAGRVKQIVQKDERLRER